MGITPEEIASLSALARISLTGEDLAELTWQINRILAYMDMLREVDTTGIEPYTCGVTDPAHLREDEPRPGLDAHEALRNAPGSAEGYFTVPNVLGGD
ncbi:MAG: Asp-tRNA(Asn)/Glu-tRNA(Gln) amidotransferase subunit GatC [Bacteroidota bacterium]|nr:Asp-tRNA(Asn)/Glu-tRNA(Gln) amidotransferase subunit GatC [Bacteroidota bacterium]